MSEGIVGTRYAKALLNLTGADNIEKIGRELEEIVELFNENENMRNVMHEPKISKAQKIVFIDEVTKKMECDMLMNKYCRYLTSRNRFDIIADISTAFSRLASAKIGAATAEITVATELSKKDQAGLEKKLSKYTGKKVTLNVKVDESILGGAITSIESLVLDGSIKNRLNLIRETISKGN